MSAATFKESVTKLAKLDVSAHKFCCSKHQKAFFDIQGLAESWVKGVGTMSPRQVAYARDIFKGKARHSASGSGGKLDPNGVVTVRCVHNELAIVRKSYLAKRTVVRCENVVHGPRKDLAKCKSLCEEHQG